ncbi:hypothetical protein G7046_g5709 [Stylonectria norvegica]|nr:hypothetical protein G7046_g5709 [Stylonectria norvegica]
MGVESEASAQRRRVLAESMVAMVMATAQREVRVSDEVLDVEDEKERRGEGIPERTRELLGVVGDGVTYRSRVLVVPIRTAPRQPKHFRFRIPSICAMRLGLSCRGAGLGGDPFYNRCWHSSQSDRTCATLDIVHATAVHQVLNAPSQRMHHRNECTIATNACLFPFATLTSLSRYEARARRDNYRSLSYLYFRTGYSLKELLLIGSSPNAYDL